MASPITGGLLSMASGLISPDVVSKASALIGETPENTRNAFDGVIPTILGGLINKASGPNGPSSFDNILGTAGAGPSVVDNIGSIFSGGHATDDVMRTGEGILSSLFGGNVSSIAGSLASRSGIRTSSAMSLLSLSAPMLVGFLNRQKELQGLSNSGLMEKLMGQRNLIAGLAPGVIEGATGAAGSAAGAAREAARDVANAGRSTAGAAREAVVRATEHRGRGWLLWLVIGAVVVCLLIWLLARRTPVASVTLPGGFTLRVPEGSLNHNLARYLADTNAGAPQSFVFEHVNFATGTTRLSGDSGKTLADTAAILRAYPNVEVRIEGHTDNTGDAVANRQLSLDRANAVRQQLIAAGVDGSRITTAGLGSDRPAASNDTAEGRARNRRIEMVVVRK